MLDKSQVEAKHDDGIHVLEAAKKLILAALNLHLVELAGIEPASTSHFRTVLHV